MNDIFERYWEKLVFDAQKRLRNYSLAEDCAQETMVTFYLEVEKGAVFNTEKQIARFLFVTNSHNASKLKYQMGIWQKGTMEIPMKSDSGDFVSSIIKEERGEQLNDALYNLPNQYVRPVISHFAYGVTYEDIAKKTGSSSDSVRKYAKRGLEKLKDELLEDGI